MDETVEIFGQSGCKYCVMARELAEQRGLSIAYHDITGRPNVRRELEQRLPVELKTVPQIFFGRRYIGGFTEFKLAVECGEIVK